MRAGANRRVMQQLNAFDSYIFKLSGDTKSFYKKITFHQHH